MWVCQVAVPRTPANNFNSSFSSSSSVSASCMEKHFCQLYSTGTLEACTMWTSFRWYCSITLWFEGHCHATTRRMWFFVSSRSVVSRMPFKQSSTNLSFNIVPQNFRKTPRPRSGILPSVLDLATLRNHFMRFVSSPCSSTIFSTTGPPLSLAR